MELRNTVKNTQANIGAASNYYTMKAKSSYDFTQKQEKVPI